MWELEGKVPFRPWLHICKTVSVIPKKSDVMSVRKAGRLQDWPAWGLEGDRQTEGKGEIQRQREIGTGERERDRERHRETETPQAGEHGTVTQAGPLVSERQGWQGQDGL